MSASGIICVYCNKMCKISDSRGYPNNKSSQRIHNRCQIKKSLSGRTSSSTPRTSVSEMKPLVDNSKQLDQVQKRFAQEECELKIASSERRMKKLIDEDSTKLSTNPENNCGQFFFDLKSGIAKPHEKRRYLHHKKLSDTISRFNDDGFQEEAVGRTYDSAGKELSAFCESDEEPCDQQQLPRKQLDKRKSSPRPREEEEEPSSKRVHVKLDKKNPCWFCLSSPNVERHLIIALGRYSYLALAKGGLVDDHLMIIPIDHISCLSDRVANSTEIMTEVEDFKNSLIEYFDRQSKGVVFFERNLKSFHWQLQAIPIDMDSIVSVESDIESISKKHYKKSNYIKLEDNCPINEMISDGSPYFYWQVEPLGSRFITLIDPKDSFPIQLGRLVLADRTILNCEDRVDWKCCVRSREEYEDLVDKIKDQYKEFNITCKT